MSKGKGQADNTTRNYGTAQRKFLKWVLLMASLKDSDFVKSLPAHEDRPGFAADWKMQHDAFQVFDSDVFICPVSNVLIPVDL